MTPDDVARLLLAERFGPVPRRERFVAGRLEPAGVYAQRRRVLNEALGPREQAATGSEAR